MKKTGVLPGFGLTLGYSVTYLGLLVLLPLAALFLKASTVDFSTFWETVTDDRAIAAYELTFTTSLVSALINAFFGLIVAWVLVRYSFPGRSIADGLVDLPFALPTAVAGIALTTVYSQTGWLGQYLEPLGIKVAFTR